MRTQKLFRNKEARRSENFFLRDLLDKWVEEEKDARVTELLDTNDETVRRMLPAHSEHLETIDEVRRALDDLDGVAPPSSDG